MIQIVCIHCSGISWINDEVGTWGERPCPKCNSNITVVVQRKKGKVSKE